MTGRFWLRLVLGVVVVAVGEAAGTCWRIVHQSPAEELRPASAIVVFGAAEYSGRPSPVYRARLDHAFDLYSRHFAPWVITTGGSGRDPSFSEGGVGAEYLVHRGIPEDSLIPETQGADTAESTQPVAGISPTGGHKNSITSTVGYTL